MSNYRCSVGTFMSSVSDTKVRHFHETTKGFANYFLEMFSEEAEDRYAEALGNMEFQAALNKHREENVQTA